MLINFFLTLRKYKLPVTIRELMDLISAIKNGVVYANVDDFYLLSRSALVKDEKNYDKFDRAFGAYFKGLEDLHGMLESLIPDEWLRHEFEKSLSEEDLKQIESLGGLEKLIEAFKKAKEEAEKAEAKKVAKAEAWWITDFSVGTSLRTLDHYSPGIVQADFFTFYSIFV